MRFAGLGIEFAAAVAGLTLLGYWIDSRFGTKPWGLLIGVFIGLVGGMYNMIQEALMATRSGADSKAASEETGSGPEADGAE